MSEADVLVQKVGGEMSLSKKSGCKSPKTSGAKRPGPKIPRVRRPGPKRRDGGETSWSEMSGSEKFVCETSMSNMSGRETSSSTVALYDCDISCVTL